MRRQNVKSLAELRVPHCLSAGLGLGFSDKTPVRPHSSSSSGYGVTSKITPDP